MEKPVDKIVYAPEKIVEKVVYVDRIKEIEKIVEKPIEVVKIIEKPIEKMVEKIVY